MTPEIETSTHGARRSAPQSSRSSWRRWALGLLAAVVAGGFIDARAEACGFPAGALPPGSYALSCTNCTVQGTTLTCDCLRINQTFNQTSLDIADCRTDPANSDGVLVCDRCDEACEVDLLTWVGGRAGAFSNPDNWEPPRVPTAEDGRHCDTVVVRGGGDVVIDVDAPAPVRGAAAVAPTPIRRIGRLEVDQCRSLSPVDGTIEVDALSPVVGERSLELRNGATLRLDAGAVLARHVAVGSLGEGTIEVVGTGGLLDTEGRLGLGIEGSGSLLVRDGATVIAAEAVLGETSAQGSVTVQGSASTFDTGSLAVGLEDDGALLVEGGARVTSDTSWIGFDLSGDSRGRATVRGKDAADNESTWTADSLSVGPRGSLVVEDGASVAVEGALKVGFEGAAADCSNGRACVAVGARAALFVGSLAVGFEGGGEVRVGEGQVGGISVRGVTAIGLTPQPGTFVLQAAALLGGAGAGGLVIAPNEGSVGSLDLLSGAQLFLIGPLRVGEGLHSTGEIVLSRDDASAAVPELTVREGTSFFGFPELPNGERPQSALLVLAPGVFRAEQDVVIEATGVLDSSGGRVELEAPARLVNRGRIRGGLTVAGDYVGESGSSVEGNVLEAPAPSGSPALRSASPLLLAPLASAPPPPAFGPIVVTGNATLAGKAKLQFGNGVAPQQGQQFELLQVEGTVTGAFDEVEIAGLAPGAAFASEIVNGVVVLTSLTDAEPLPYVNLAGKPLLLESKKAAKLKLTRSGDTAAPLTVAYTVGGTATSGVDYAALPGTIQFPARKKSVTLLVQPIADGAPEGSETIEITLAPDASFAPGLASTLTIELRDGKAK
jgi:T5SS/PEP-CTERM-associated repeat protein